MRHLRLYAAVLCATAFSPEEPDLSGGAPGRDIGLDGRPVPVTQENADGIIRDFLTAAHDAPNAHVFATIVKRAEAYLAAGSGAHRIIPEAPPLDEAALARSTGDAAAVSTMADPGNVRAPGLTLGQGADAPDHRAGVRTTVPGAVLGDPAPANAMAPGEEI
jgi:hypothetical protein